MRGKLSYYGNQNPAVDAQPVRGVAERELWQTVVMQALLDATHELDTNTSMVTAAEKHKAVTWIKAGGQDFRDVVTWAGMDHEFVREAFLSGKVNGDLLRGIGPQRDRESRRHKRESEIIAYLEEPRTAAEVARHFGMIGPGAAREVFRQLAREGMIEPAGQIDYVQMWRATDRPLVAKPKPKRHANSRTQGRIIKWTDDMEQMIESLRSEGLSYSQIADQLAIRHKIKAPTPNAISARLKRMQRLRREAA